MGSSMLMRRLSFLVVLIAALAFASSAAAKRLFVVDGRGWGHGVGMSQWGAQGRALAGQDHRAILRIYYRGTTIGVTRVRTVRVQLFRGSSSLTLSSDADFTIGSRTLRGRTVYTAVRAANGEVRIEGVGRFGNPATVEPGSADLRVNGAPYRGSFKIWVRSGRLAVVNYVGLQSYLLSVVPREMPAWFDLKALAAQAVAARSYAIRSRRSSWFDLYDEVRSQVYGGVAGEDPSGRATSAVQQTVREVVLYGGEVAQTFFSSSNGGYEASSADVWGGSVPYLQARRDSYDLTPGNPNRYWKHRFSPRRLGRALGIAPPSDVSVARDGSSRAETVTFTNRSGTPSLAGTSVQSELGLKSRRYWIGVQSLSANRTSATCRQRVRFAVFAHRVGGVRLQRRAATADSWTDMTLTAVDGTHWTASHRPCVTNDYRLVSGKARGPYIHLPVSSAAGIETVRATYVTGHVNPLLPGVPVLIQRRDSSGWTTVATAMIASDGSFRANFALAESRYRAIVIPPGTTGLMTGYSPPVTVRFR